MTDHAAKPGPESGLENQVRSALEACRRGDFEPSSALQEAGPAVVPLLAPWLGDKDERVRDQAVSLAGTLGAPALPLLARALDDTSEAIRERAAHALYFGPGPAAVESIEEIGASLRRGVASGDRSAAALLLLGYFPGDDTVEVLRKVRDEDPPRRTKLESWCPPVDAALPARVALSRLGEQEDRTALLGAVADADAGWLEFMLGVLREIDAPELLLELAATLDNTTEIGGGVPSGVEPRRRLCDLAVDAFAHRMSLDLSFELRDGLRYTDEELQAVRAALGGSVPR